ncbi:related to nuclear regulator [Sporisorium scitamineum]|uniref:Exosome complex protein n=1 Tax=Sporisorium scitamineum TaxID=49012 RepID=A0A0F7RUH8_9BASI|nr:hypothetical protein [Sporisorium scitamineum]CDU23199.1 related to nuclear regulator [Sporisorium scitamineum]
MSSLRQSPLPALQALSSSFTDLTAILQPLLAHNYEQLNAALQSNSSQDNAGDELHGRLDAARMQVSVAYVLMDLVWILLKTKGVDPTNHPVMQELERVKSYFGKIKRVQEDEKEPEQGAKLDRSAAGRFIRAALAGEPGSTTGKHTKFDEENETPSEAKATPSQKTASPAPAAAPAATSTPSSKKKRPAIDPFEGYDKPKTPKTTPATPAATDSASSSPWKKQKKSKKSSK